MKLDKNDPKDSLDPRDPLWELLGKAREPKDRPFFVGKVMRAVREGSQGSSGSAVSVWAWLRAKWAVTAVATACAVIGAVLMMQPPVTPSRIVDNQLPVSNPDPIEKVIEDSIEQLIAAEDHSEWLSADQSSFLP